MRWISLAVLLCPWGAMAKEPLAYVRASSQYGRGEKPAQFHPLNLMDEDLESHWCEGAEGDGEGEEIRLFFKKQQRIDHLVVHPSNQSGRKVLKVRISDGLNSVLVRPDQKPVEETLDKPLEGKTFTVSIESIGPVNEASKLPADVACLGQVLLFYKNKLFGGRMKQAQFRYSKLKDRVLGSWNGEPLGAPESFITFALDGTWEWQFEALISGKRQRLSGEYRFKGSRLYMRSGETGRWSDMKFRYRRVIVDPDEIGAPSGDYDMFFLGDALGDGIKGQYDNADF